MMMSQLTQDELVFSWIVQNFDELHHVRVVQFLQDGDLAVDVVQRALHLNAVSSERRPRADCLTPFRGCK